MRVLVSISREGPSFKASVVETDVPSRRGRTPSLFSSAIGNSPVAAVKKLVETQEGFFPKTCQCGLCWDCVEGSL